MDFIEVLQGVQGVHNFARTDVKRFASSVRQLGRCILFNTNLVSAKVCAVVLPFSDGLSSY